MINTLDYKNLSQTEKYLFSFASLFKDIYIFRNGGYILVPVLYSSGQKLYDIANMRDMSEVFGKNYSISNVVPQLAIEFFNPFMDSMRQLNKTNSENGNWNPAPLTLDTRLYCRTKHKTDLFQIFEMIVPIFQPNVNLNVTIYDGSDGGEPIINDIDIQMIDVEMDLPMVRGREEQDLEEFTLYFHIDCNFNRVKKTPVGKVLDFEIITDKNDNLEEYDG